MQEIRPEIRNSKRKGDNDVWRDLFTLIMPTSQFRSLFFEPSKFSIYTACKFDPVCPTKIKVRNNQMAVPNAHGNTIAVLPMLQSDGQLYENEKYENFEVSFKMGKPIHAFEWALEGKLLAVAAKTDGLIRVFSIDSPDELYCGLAGHEKRVECLKFSSLASTILATTSL